MIPENPYFWKFPENHDLGGAGLGEIHSDCSAAAVFTNPFRYIPDGLVMSAGKLVIDRLDQWSCMPVGANLREIERSFAEGKMLGVLVCAASDHDGSKNELGELIRNGKIGFIAGFSGSVKGADGLVTCTVEGFVPPIIDITDPEGYFKKEEAEISGLNKKLDSLISSDELTQIRLELKSAEAERNAEIEKLQTQIRISKAQREEVRKTTSDPSVIEELIRESQFQKAELKRCKDRWKERISEISSRLIQVEGKISEIKSLRSSRSDALQKWIFENAIVFNAVGEHLSIWEVFTKDGLIPPGGTGDCAAPKLLNYAYQHGLTPLAMGEFWYGKSPDTAVRTHGHFYPSCTSKCGPLLVFMLKGLSICSEPGRPCNTCEANPSVENFKYCQANELNHIYEDDNIVIIEKPSGMPSVPGLDGRISALEILGEGYHAVHRLDMDTSGVMIFAKTSEAAVNLRKQFEEHTVQKTYQARICRPDSFAYPRVESSISEEHPMAQKGNICLPLSADYDERPRQKVDFIQGKPAHTDYELLCNNPDGTSDVLLYPHTGRTHQLRVHCSHHLGLSRPIVGDLLYGAYSVDAASEHIQISQAAISSDAHHSPAATQSNAQRLCLHALNITFLHPRTGMEMTFTSAALSY